MARVRDVVKVTIEGVGHGAQVPLVVELDGRRQEGVGDGLVRVRVRVRVRMRVRESPLGSGIVR